MKEKRDEAGHRHDHSRNQNTIPMVSFFALGDVVDERTNGDPELDNKND